MFGSAYWFLVILLTIVGLFKKKKIKIKDNRSKKGYREETVKEGSFISILGYSFIAAIILSSIIFWIFD